MTDQIINGNAHVLLGLTGQIGFPTGFNKFLTGFRSRNFYRVQPTTTTATGQQALLNWSGQTGGQRSQHTAFYSGLLPGLFRFLNAARCSQGFIISPAASATADGHRS